MSTEISLIIPVYNTAKYLDKLFSSIERQSFKDFEVLVIDDGSTDDSPKICDDWAARDSRFKIIHQKNAGQSAARNAGIDAATGNFLAFADSDDDVSEDYLKKLAEAQAKYNADVVLCSYYECHSDEKKTMGPLQDGILDHDKAMEMIVEDKVLRSFFWASLFKKELFEGIRLPVGRNYEDLAVIYKLYYKAGIICTISDALYHYQIRVGSMSYNDSTAKTWHEKCHFNVLSQTERSDFFREKGEHKLYRKSLAMSIPYIYSDILTGYQTGCDSDSEASIAYLKKEKKEILNNPNISVKNKMLFYIYTGNRLVFNMLYGRKLKTQ